MNKYKLLNILDNFIFKAIPEWKAIQNVADSYVSDVFTCYSNAFRDLKQSINVDVLSQSSIPLMEKEINWNVFEKACFKNYDIIASVILDAGTQAAFYLSRKSLTSRSQSVAKDSPPPAPEATLGDAATAQGSFNMRNPEAIAWAVDYVGNNIREVEEETRKAVRAIISNALDNGGHPYETAQKIKDYIGLTERQMEFILKYERMLRDDMYSESEIEKLVSKKVKRMIIDRAKTIARTETIDSACQGQILHWQDMAKQGYLNTTTFKETWIVTPDDKLCPACKILDGETVDIGKSFSWGGRRPTRHPKCRCAIGLTEVKGE